MVYLTVSTCLPVLPTAVCRWQGAADSRDITNPVNKPVVDKETWIFPLVRRPREPQTQLVFYHVRAECS